MVETRGFEPLTPCVQTRIGIDFRQITKRRQGVRLRVLPTFSLRRHISASLHSARMAPVRLRWLRHAEGTSTLEGWRHFGSSGRPVRRFKVPHGLNPPSKQYSKESRGPFPSPVEVHALRSQGVLASCLPKYSAAQRTGPMTQTKRRSNGGYGLRRT